MAAPLAPMGLIPCSGQSIATTNDNVFSWQSDGSQAAFYIEWMRNAAGASSSNTGWQTDSLSSYIFVASTFTNTWEYKWRVKIRNSAGQESVFSDWAMFRTGSAPGVAITFPANDLDVLSTVPVYQHAYSNPDGFYQVAYQYRLFTGTTWDDFDALTAAQQESMTWDQLEAYSTGTVLWDSGRVESTDTSVPQPSDKLLIMQYWYKVQVTIWDNAGNEVTSDIRTYGLLVESVPQIPTISVVSDGENGRNVATIINPLPTVGQASADHNRLYRRKLDGGWELVQDNIAIVSGNLLSVNQASIETDTTGWSGYQATISRDTTEHCEGAASLKVVTNNVFSFEGAHIVRIDAEGGTVYSARVMIKGTAGRILRITLFDYDNTVEGTLASKYIDLTLDGTWQEVKVENLTAHADADSLGLSIWTRTKQSLTFYVDAAQINEGATATDWELPSVVGIGYDTTCRAGVEEEYAASAVSADGIESSKSESATATCNLNSYWFTNLTTSATVKLHSEPRWGQMQSERNRAEYSPIDEKYITVLYGPQRFYRGNFQALLFKPSDDTLWRDYMQTIADVLDSDSGDTVLMRSPFGDMLKLNIYNLQFEQNDRMDTTRWIRFDMVEVVEAVPVGTFTYDTPPAQLNGFWIVDPDTGLGMRLNADPKWGAIATERDRAEMIGLSSEMPTVSYGNKKAKRSGFTGLILPPSSGSLAQEVMRLRELVDSRNKKPLLFRSISRDMVLVDVYGFTFELYDRTSQARKVSFEFVEIGGM